jgi:hypothetical protein
LILSFHPISSIKQMIFHGYSGIEHGWNSMEEMKLWMTYILWREYQYTSMNFFQWSYFTLEYHEISSQELWLNVWRVMTKGPSIHQPKFMNEIACLFIHGIYIKLHGQMKLSMHFCGWNKTPSDIALMKVFHFQTKRNFIQLFHSSTVFHLVGSVGINKKIHIIAFGHDAHR